jgi:hypothetical protein
MSTPKLFYDESYTYFNNWYKFLNEQADAEAMAQTAAEDQARAEAEAQRKEQEIMIVRQNMAPVMAEFGTMLVQARDAGDSGGQIADVHIRDIAAIMSDLANQEIGIEDFLGDISDELGQTGKDLQKEMS